MLGKVITKLTSGVAAISVSFALAAAAYAQERPMSTVDREAFAARGATLTRQDPMAEAMRNSQPDEAAQNGFNIGMAIAEGHTAPGPGKEARCASLLRNEPGGCRDAVLFSVERNRNAVLAAKGVALAARDSAFDKARDDASSKTRFRRRADLVFFLLGFNIGLGASEGQTAPGPGKDKIRDELLHPYERAGFNQAVSFALEYNRRIAGQMTSGTTDGPSPDRVVRSNAGTTDGPGSGVASREIRCRGYARTGGSEYVFFQINSRPISTGETLVTYEIAFSPDTRAAGTRGENLRPGFCAFVDRPIAASGPYRIRFETVANAQLKQKLQGSAVDTSPTAAENYPDVNTIPVYLKGEGHYWSFGGITDSGRGYFVATGHGFWKPAVAIDNLPVGSPTAPARRIPYPTKP